MSAASADAVRCCLPRGIHEGAITCARRNIGTVAGQDNNSCKDLEQTSPATSTCLYLSCKGVLCGEAATHDTSPEHTRTYASPRYKTTKRAASVTSTRQIKPFRADATEQASKRARNDKPELRLRESNSRSSTNSRESNASAYTSTPKQIC